MAIRSDGIRYIHGMLTQFIEVNKIPDSPFNNIFNGYKLIDLGNTVIRNDAVDYLSTVGIHILLSGSELDQMDYKDFKESGNTEKTYSMKARDYFGAMGFNYKCIDLNAEDGALPFDLRSSMIDNDKFNLINSADLILDCGTSEHIEYQYQQWKNLYDMCKVGGMFIHVLPKVGFWENHCEFKYDIKFFTDLAEANNYEIINLDNSVPEKNIRVCMIKTNNNGFMSEDDFNKLSIHVCKVEGTWAGDDGKEHPNQAFNDRALYPWAYLREATTKKFVDYTQPFINPKGEMCKVDINEIKKDIENNELGNRSFDEWLKPIGDNDGTNRKGSN